MLLVASLALLAAADAPAPSASREVAVRSADGTQITGTADLPNGRPAAAVVMVAGTGLFDRDVRLGRSNTPRDLLFKDLADRMTALGLAAVRYDRRGVNHGGVGAGMLNPAVSGTSTVETQRDDLRAVYDWTRASAGLGARCVILLGHSEGVMTIARLAESGAPPPAAVFAIGAPMRSPADVLRWQMAERDVYSLRRMDEDGDGRVTTAEVERNWRKTPSSAFDLLEPLKHPSGAWSAADLEAVGRAQAGLYEQQRQAALALDDAAPYPNATTPMARSSWWKSWFTDTQPVALRLARWNVPVTLHYGEIDSQTPPHNEAAAARTYLGARAAVTVHPARGHSLGEHALFGPMDEAIADRIAGEVRAAARGCR
jgi:pimeloyl-ACP methyl ester carboxylesterase